MLKEVKSTTMYLSVGMIGGVWVGTCVCVCVNVQWVLTDFPALCTV